jgi:hypothetical protein
MTLIEAMMLMPQRGAPMVADRELATVLAASSARFVRRHAMLWSLTDDGQRFLAQFKLGRSEALSQVTVRPVSEAGGAVFHLLRDAEAIQSVGKADLHRKLRELQRDNPDVKIVFDFRRPGGMS